MKRELLFVLPSPFRDEFRIQGFRFGSGEKSIAIVGAMRGDELQQQFICSQLVSTLQDLEEKGELPIVYGANVYPCTNCGIGWASISTEGCKSCHDDCEKLKEYYRKEYDY
jgi:predicted deacylase